MQLQLKKYRLQLKHTFTISRESHDFQDSIVVGLSEDSVTGYGESTSNPYYNITQGSLENEINTVRNEIEKHEFTNPDNFYELLNSLELTNFAKCALDLAANDLYGKLLGKPLYKIWGTSSYKYPITNFTIGIADVDTMVAKMKEQPWPIYKIKLGTADDVALVTELRKHTDAIFRVDANCAWSAEETIQNSSALKDLGVEFIEQPLKASNWEGMRSVINASQLPIIADESCILPEDVSKCHGHFTGINIKLTKCGGLTPARKMITEARSLDLKVMVGCMTESSVGISAIAQLTPQLDYVDMDGALLLKEDIASGIQINADGSLIFPKTGGSGIHLL
ncbi:dipeptide epimerase [Spongiivirga citrea]|uniref:Dipeptide epimerase n=1 Tax=Spongiivirga citrea TaxID=1481457 RepID=A0A6M0CE83_9FLAO|nr:dipeptide epimerase [Spongiivirga citrea]NER15722.1 dipeptide epimerase [Spongiivirga citrea]